MKKITTLLALMLISLGGLFAQINLEHTFSDVQVNWFKSTDKGIMYYAFDDSTRVLKIFNSDYSLYKTTTLTIPTITGTYDNKWNGYEIFCMNDKLYNSDSKVEFLLSNRAGGYTYNSTTYQYTSGSYSNLFLYDEDGNIIKDFGAFTDGGNYVPDSTSIINSGSVYKLFVTKRSAKNKMSTDIYSLPGSVPSSNVILRSASLDQLPAYPSPASTIVNIPYILKAGETTTLYIYDQSGALVTQKEIDATFDCLKLDVTSYVPGLYVYKYNNMTGRFMVN